MEQLFITIDMLYLLKTRIKYTIKSEEFMEICTQVALGQDNEQWIWKIWGHNPEDKIVEITYLLDNKEDMQKGIDFIESMGELYHFVVESVTHEEFIVMEEPSVLTHAPLG